MKTDVTSFFASDAVRILLSAAFMTLWTPLVRFEGFDAVRVLLSANVLLYFGFWLPVVAAVRLLWFLLYKKKDQPFEKTYRSFVEETRVFGRKKVD